MSAMDRPVQLPVRVGQLMAASQSIDLAAEIRQLLEDGRRRVTLGLGPGVDVPLLDEELYQAEVELVDRELVVAAVRAEPDGYVVERGWSNFGVYVWSIIDPMWTSVPHHGAIRGLRPGDQVALGSTPADALKFHLPESHLVPPARIRRTARQRAAAEQHRSRPGATTPSPTPAAVAAHGTAADTSPIGAPSARSADRSRFQIAFDHALLHWRYDMVTFGSDPASVIVLDDPSLASVKAALRRNIEQPHRGYDLFVKDPGAGLWVAPAGAPAEALARGAVVRLKGPGNRLGFGPYVVELPAPAVPTPRFSPEDPPQPVDIARILGLTVEDLDDEAQVKASHRSLVKRFHPDLHPDDQGHLSRFLEIQAAFEAWRLDR